MPSSPSPAYPLAGLVIQSIAANHWKYSLKVKPENSRSSSDVVDSEKIAAEVTRGASAHEQSRLVTSSATTGSEIL
jgi:hypothetical protein